MEWDQETGLREEGQQAAQKKMKSQDLIFAFFSSEFSPILPRSPEVWLGRRAHTCNPALRRWREEGHKFKVSLHTFTMMTEYPICSPQWILNKPKKGSRGNRKKNRGRDSCRQSWICGCLLTAREPKQKNVYRATAMEGKDIWTTLHVPRLQKGHMATATQYTTVRQSQPFSEENLRNYSASQEQERAWDWSSAPTSAPTPSS